ncbi:MAG: hypothetical protein E7623_03400, partial [Ruminococcaceae bacterium]|nr:hypothetical protein [Oscillospiraceae bacterium]
VPKCGVDDFIKLGYRNIKPFNCFQDVISDTVKDIDIIRDIMNKCGAVCSLMSGSGPSVFGIFDSETDVLRAKEELLKNDFSAFFCSLVSC